MTNPTTDPLGLQDADATRLSAQAVEISTALSDAGCSAMPIAQAVHQVISERDSFSSQLAGMRSALAEIQAKMPKSELRGWHLSDETMVSLHAAQQKRCPACEGGSSDDCAHAELISVDFAARSVYDAFVKSESAGHRSRDRQFAIGLLGKALGLPLDASRCGVVGYPDGQRRVCSRAVGHVDEYHRDGRWRWIGCYGRPSISELDRK